MLTADCTMEQNKRRAATVVVDSGTHAGIHVPVCDFRSMTIDVSKSNSSSCESQKCRVEVEGIADSIQ